MVRTEVGAGQPAGWTPGQPCPLCGRRHRSWYGAATCRWPKAAWVQGDARWASVSFCPRGITAQLYPTRQEAEKAVAFINRLGCGGSCMGPGRHRLVDLGEAA